LLVAILLRIKIFVSCPSNNLDQTDNEL
jgi:hypothetical protein